MSMLDQLKSLDSAEAFFRCLDVPHDPEILAFARLHILKCMGEGLARLDLTTLDDVGVRAAARQTLTVAYSDLAETGPLGRRAFKVLRDHDPKRPAKARGRSFVALGDIGAAR